MNLYVGNISPAVQPAELQQIFAGMGEVVYAKLASGGETQNAGPGFAFVFVPNEERARTAVAALNGKELKGEKLTVSTMSERPGVLGVVRK
jgi:RNA recognition motif-containing protein